MKEQTQSDIDAKTDDNKTPIDLMPNMRITREMPESKELRKPSLLNKILGMFK